MSTTYQPGRAPTAYDPSFFNQESNRLKVGLEDAAPHHDLQELHAQPSRVRTGMVVSADGSDWNPGYGKGAYFRQGSEWVHLAGRDAFNIKNYAGADSSGVADSLAAFNLAAAAAGVNGQVIVPPGIWKLSASTSSCNWIVDAGASFTGAGALVGRRVQFGNAYDASHGARFGNVVSFCEALRPNTERASDLVSLSTIGHTGMLGASQALNNSVPASMGCIGVVGYAFNNNTSNIQTVYGGYYEARRTALAGSAQGLEVDIVNMGATVANHPYSMGATGFTNALWLASGGEVSANPASIALGIIANGATFAKGIQFGATAIQGCDGVTGMGEAIGFAKGHYLQWYGAAGTDIGYIANNVSAAANATNISFEDIGFTIKSVDDSTALQVVNVSGATTWPKLLASAGVGKKAYFAAEGTTANLDVFMAPKGTGVLGVTYGSTVATTPASFVAARWLPFKDGNDITWYIPIATSTW